MKQLRLSVFMYAVFIILASLLSSGPVYATLIENGDFEDGLTGWQIDRGVVTPDNGAAELGRPGPDPDSILLQRFELPVTTGLVEISFEYVFILGDDFFQPTNVDTFTAFFGYDTTTTAGQIVEGLVDLNTKSPLIGTQQLFSGIFSVSDVAAASDNAYINFRLDESKTIDARSGAVGTKVIIDNVVVASVPEPATMLLLGAGLIGLAGFGRKKLINKKV